DERAISQIVLYVFGCAIQNNESYSHGIGIYRCVDLMGCQRSEEFIPGIRIIGIRSDRKSVE
uniref:Uncharacterized protein n=1 Tax=Panagrolaimus sp. JU765 TaxID=591449 RepID=A0AC34R740_9BILA